MKSLMAAAQRGDTDSWRKLIRANELALICQVSQRVHNAGEVQDIVQEVFVEALSEPPVTDEELPVLLRQMAQQRIRDLG